MHFPLFGERKQMGNFSQKVDKFIDIFLNQNGYVKVVQGLQNTLLIAITGLIIGIVIGTLIATVRPASDSPMQSLQEIYYRRLRQMRPGSTVPGYEVLSPLQYQLPERFLSYSP